MTLVHDIDSLSYSQITWRVIMSFAGALTVVVIAMYSGFFGEGSRVFMMTEAGVTASARGRASARPAFRYCVCTESLRLSALPWLR